MSVFSVDTLVLDAGDAFSLDLSFTKTEAELTLESFSLIGVDVFTPGETEFIFGLPFLKAAADNAEFEVIAANIIDPSTGLPVFGKEYTVITLKGGLRVAITGILDETIKSQLMNNNLSIGDMKQKGDQTARSTLKKEGIKKVLAGITTFDEVKRVTSNLG